MKKLIFRKFLLDVTIFFIISALSLTLIVWVIQAVNYLDFVSEDGHSFRVYFLFTLLSIPKIFSKLIIFLFFISIFFIIVKYEENNEILIFWTHGVKKIQLINIVFIFSFFILIIQVFLNLFIVPKTQDLARSYIRSSNIDYFPALIKPKQFNDTVEDLTIFIDKRKKNGEFEKIFLKDRFKSGNSQIISSKKGAILYKNGNYFLSLYDGKIINIDKKNITTFKFSKTEFNLSKFSTKTTTFPKIQELNSLRLLKCLVSVYKNKKFYTTPTFSCDIDSINPVSQELYKRTLNSIYILIVSLIACGLIIKSKDDFNYEKYKFIIFCIGVFAIILSELSTQYIKYDSFVSILLISLPFILSISIYSYLNFKSNFQPS